MRAWSAAIWDDSTRGRTGQRFNGRLGLRVPAAVIREKCRSYALPDPGHRLPAHEAEHPHLIASVYRSARVRAHGALRGRLRLGREPPPASGHMPGPRPVARAGRPRDRRRACDRLGADQAQPTGATARRARRNPEQQHQHEHHDGDPSPGSLIEHVPCPANAVPGERAHIGSRSTPGRFGAAILRQNHEEAVGINAARAARPRPPATSSVRCTRSPKPVVPMVGSRRGGGLRRWPGSTPRVCPTAGPRPGARPRPGPGAWPTARSGGCAPCSSPGQTRSRCRR
jgi:hypothetical protein